jgi:arylsulfatase A
MLSKIKTCGLLSLIIFFAKPIFAQKPPLNKTRPNIIFILADDLGYMDLGCYGNPFNETPNLDALAKGGIRFTQAYAASTVCSPSRAAIMTGKHPARLKLTNFLGGYRTDSASPVNPAEWIGKLSGSETTLAERLKPLGYQTAMIGKWHLNGGDSSLPWQQGFDFTRMIDKNGLDYYNYSIVTEGGKTVFQDKGTDYLTDKLTDYALEFINNRKTEQPFLLYLPYSAPHVLLVPKAQKMGKYYWKYEKHGSKYSPSYAAMIESMDEGIGRIVQNLKEKGLLENTLIVFTSDNGGVGLPELGERPTNNEPLRKWKGHMYEGGIRVPAIWFWQGKIQPQETPQYFQHIDYVPTILEMVGAKTDAPFDGKSVWQMAETANKTVERGKIYWHYPHFSNQQGRPAGAMRDGDWKLVENYETGALELYNLKDDLSEAKNLAPQYPDKVKEMHNQFLSWRKEVRANMPIQKKK